MRAAISIIHFQAGMVTLVNQFRSLFPSCEIDLPDRILVKRWSGEFHDSDIIQQLTIFYLYCDIFLNPCDRITANSLLLILTAIK